MSKGRYHPVVRIHGVNRTLKPGIDKATCVQVVCLSISLHFHIVIRGVRETAECSKQQAAQVNVLTKMWKVQVPDAIQFGYVN